MSALGQKWTSRSEIGMSTLPPKADIAGRRLDVRFVPKADIDRYSIASSASEGADAADAGLCVAGVGLPTSGLPSLPRRIGNSK
jgi:hypothetical protein